MIETYELLAGSLVAVVGVCVALLNRQRTLQYSVDRLTRQMSVYAEASTRVADTLDRAMTSDRPPVAPRSARREVLGEARARLAAGRSPDQISVELGLSEDERALLAALPPIAVQAG